MPTLLKSPRATCQLVTKSGELITIEYDTTVISSGHWAKVYNVTNSPPGKDWVIRISESKLFPRDPVLYGFDAVIATSQPHANIPPHITLLTKGRDLENHLMSLNTR